MNNSRLFDVVKAFYDEGTYKKEDVAKFVEAGKLTKEEYELITGEKYDE